MKNDAFVNYMYTSKTGRMLLKFILHSKVLVLGEHFMNSPLSKPLIKKYIRKYNMDMSDFEGQTYDNFQQFFGRTRCNNTFDENKDHLISPCDGMLSMLPIKDDTVYPIKGSSYRLSDLVNDSAVAKEFRDGTCLILRLRATDYHHYCYIDDGYQYDNIFIPGQLHSVQPIACETFPVYRLNRRMWTLMETDNFGKVAQIEIGALLVGGMINDNSNCRINKGEEMGHFELAGSTIALLFQKDKIQILDSIEEMLKQGSEYEVKMGDHIGFRKKQHNLERMDVCNGKGKTQREA